MPLLNSEHNFSSWLIFHSPLLQVQGALGLFDFLKMVEKIRFDIIGMSSNKLIKSNQEHPHMVELSRRYGKSPITQIIKCKMVAFRDKNFLPSFILIQGLTLQVWLSWD